MHAKDTKSLRLLFETSLFKIRIQINKIMNSDRFKGEPLNKISFSNEAIYYKGETPFCLISETTALKIETMDVIYALYNNI